MGKVAEEEEEETIEPEDLVDFSHLRSECFDVLGD
jgi:hypothetical protein